METLVSGDELVGEGQTGHHLAFLEPENGAEGPAEEDALKISLNGLWEINYKPIKLTLK